MSKLREISEAIEKGEISHNVATCLKNVTVGYVGRLQATINGDTYCMACDDCPMQSYETKAKIPLCDTRSYYRDCEKTRKELGLEGIMDGNLFTEKEWAKCGLRWKK